MSVDLSNLSDSFECPTKASKVTQVSDKSYYTVTENVQLLSDGTGSQDECWDQAWNSFVQHPIGNAKDVWIRLLNLLEPGDRFVFFAVFFLFDGDVMDAIVNAIKRDVTCIAVMTMETEFHGDGSINMGNQWQTEQRNYYLGARSASGNKGILFPFHNMSFTTVNGGQSYPWLYNGSPQGGNILHAKMLVWDKKSYPAVYIGSQNPEIDDEDMGITVENCPALAQDALSIIDKFIYASIIQQASRLVNVKTSAIDQYRPVKPGKPADFFIGYINYGGVSYLPGNPYSNQIKGGESWASIEKNLPSVLTNLQAKSDAKLDKINFSLDPKVFSNFPLVTKYNDENRLQMQTADWSGYQNYQCIEPNITFSWMGGPVQTSPYYGITEPAQFYVVMGGPQFCLADSGTTYNLTAIARAINCAKTNLDIANMDPEVYNFELWQWLIAAVQRGVHLRMIIGEGQGNVNNGSLRDLIDKCVAGKSKGTIAIRIWDKNRKFSCYARGNHSSVYHCKYFLTEERLYLGNQNLNPMFYGSMGGVGLLIDQSGPLRDQFQNYFNRDWESGFAIDYQREWGVGGGAQGIDPCFKYGPAQTLSGIKMPTECAGRMQAWQNRSLYKTDDGKYLGACTELSTKTGCCLPKDLISVTTSNCEVDNIVSPHQTDTMCRPQNSLEGSKCDQTLSYRFVITVPQAKYNDDFASIFPPNSHDTYNPPDGRPSSGGWTETYSAWIAATDRAKHSIDCVLIYSNLTHDKKSTAYGFYQSLRRAIERKVHVRLVFCWPPNANADVSANELRGLKYDENNNWAPRNNVELYYTNYYNLFMESDQTKLDYVDPFKGPSSGILHTKLYVWDEEEAYVGAQNQEVPIAIESGIMLRGNNCVINDLKKVVDYYVLSSCLQCRGLGVEAMHGLEKTEQFQAMQSKFDSKNPLRVKMTDEGNGPYKGKSMMADVYVSATPLASAKTLNRTFDLDAIVDVIERAKSDVYIAAMDLSDLTDFYNYRTYHFNQSTQNPVKGAKFMAMFDAIEKAVEKGVNVKIMVGLRRSFGDDKAEPCGYNPKNVAALAHLCEDLNKKGPGSLHAKFIRFDCKAAGFCYGIFHTKFIITDQSVLIDTSNFTGDYFISTAGISFVAHRVNEKEVAPLNNDMLNFYRKFWNSKLAITVEDVICQCNTDLPCKDGKMEVSRKDTLAIEGCVSDFSKESSGQCIPFTKQERKEAKRKQNVWVIWLIVAVLLIVFIALAVYLYRRHKR